MSGLDGRLRRLEGRGSRCPDCGLTQSERRNIAVINEEHPDKSFKGDPDERCPSCGQFLYTAIHVVYGEEGEGCIPIG